MTRDLNPCWCQHLPSDLVHGMFNQEIRSKFANVALLSVANATHPFVSDRCEFEDYAPFPTLPKGFCR